MFTRIYLYYNNKNNIICDDSLLKLIIVRGRRNEKLSRIERFEF